MPKRHQQRPAKEAAGRNNPKKSTVITTGGYKKHETDEKQAAEHINSAAIAQEEKIPPTRDPRMGMAHKADSRAMEAEGEQRSGSDSDADKHRKGSRLHENHHDENQPMFVQESDNFDHDLRPNNLAGENHGLQGQTPVGYGQPAIEIKSLHTQLADLTDDELRNLEIVPEGTRLEQGATYFDLRHPDQDEFVAMGNMVAGPDNSYISKKETDYVLWNRIMGVTNPARLDEAE
ncbi:MAG: hypothetical protein ABI396_07400 [Ktedonobacteraceae bacterium]